LGPSPPQQERGGLFWSGPAAPPAEGILGPIHDSDVADDQDKAKSYPIALPLPPGWRLPLEDCITCHRRRQQPAPPPALPIPPSEGPQWFPPDISARDAGGWGSSPRRSGDDRKQCQIQYDRDHGICGGQPDPVSVAICKASIMPRFAHCQYTGE